jgi:predicted ester cyclase
MTTYLKMKLDRIPLEVFSQGKLHLVDELYAPHFIERSPRPGMAAGRDGVKQFVASFRTALPNLRYTVDDTIEAGDKFVTRLTGSGTMHGEFAGVPATGKHAIWSEIHIVRVTDEQVVEHWGLVEEMGMMVQLGIIPAPGRTLRSI